MNPIILNIATKGLSAGAKIILKQLKTLIKKSKKTTKDKEKISKLKKELNADKTVKEKKKVLQDKKLTAEVKEGSRTKTISKKDRGEAKNQATRYESGKKQEIDDAWYKGMNKRIADMHKEQNKRMGLSEDGLSMKYSTGGLSSKKYMNPIKVVDNLKKKKKKNG